MSNARTFLDKLAENQPKIKSEFEIFKFEHDQGEWRLFICPNKKDPTGLPHERDFLHWGFKNPKYGKPGFIRCGGRGCPLCALAKKYNNRDLRAKLCNLYYVLDENFNRKLLRSYGDHQGSLSNEITEEIKKVAQIDDELLCDFGVGRFCRVRRRKIGDKNIWSVEAESSKTPIPNHAVREFELAPNPKQAYQSFTHQDLLKIAAEAEGSLGGASPEEEAAYDAGYVPTTQPDDSSPSATTEDSTPKPKLTPEETQARLMQLKKEMLLKD